MHWENLGGAGGEGGGRGDQDGEHMLTHGCFIPSMTKFTTNKKKEEEKRQRRELYNNANEDVRL